MSGFVARLTMDDGSVVVWEPADPAVISVAEQVDVGEHIGSLVAAAPGKTYPKSLVVDNVKSVQYAPGVYRDPAEAAAHARGVAEERARWSVEALAKAIVASQTFAAHSAGCPVWRDRMKELDGVLVDLDTCTCLVKSDAPYTARRILAAMAPSSPSDARGGPEGSAGV